MFRIANPEYLYALLVIPALIVFFWYGRRQRRKALALFGQKDILSVLTPNVSSGRPVLKFIILLLALASIIIGIARPQFGSKLKTEKRKGIELIIALDVSYSMMAEDIQPSRLERAKRAISQLVDKLSSDQIGLIVFAGDAYTQLPITADYVSAKLFLSSISPEMVPTQGTAIGAAIELGMKSFNPQFEGSKAMIIITDGENHEDDAVGAATEAAKQGIIVYTLGMGLPQGGPIPEYVNGQKSYRKTREGSIIVTKLNEPMLQKIAEAGKGAYIRANNAQVGLNNLLSEVNKMEKSELETQIYADYADQFQYFIGLGLFLILLDFLILERKNKYLKNLKLFGDRK
ncbi:MAG TPA: VWA domain-containing protein [Prolixibacteraceae bacterium]|nr:VWA domain-containing protein [Prolixibacteraceae bacterium]